MKSHKYWSLGALATMIGTFYTGYKDMKSAHKYFACSSLLCHILLHSCINHRLDNIIFRLQCIIFCLWCLLRFFYKSCLR